MTLSPCYWNRVECPRCGNYDVADDRSWKGTVVCVKCKTLEATVTIVLEGRTTRELPFVGSVMPKTDTAGNILSQESIHRGRKAAQKANRNGRAIA